MLFSYYRRPMFLLLILYAGGLFVFRGLFLKPPPALPFALPRSGVLVEGRVSGYPSAAPGGQRFSLETSKIYGRPLKTGLMVYVRSAGAASYGDIVSFLADMETPQGASVPGGLDWAGYLARRGIAAQARAAEIEIIGGPGPVIRLARYFRYSALASFEAGLSPEAASVLAGVVLGEKKSVPPGLKAAFQDSGAMHLLVASGSNVGFMVAVVYFLCSRLRLGRRFSGGAALVLAGFYVLAAGFDAPLVRAYFMYAAGLCAWLLSREAGAFHALTAAALAILLFSPRSLFDAGFQMSFLAAYGLTVGLPVWRGCLKVRGWGAKALGLLTVSFFAQLCLYPLLALYFHKISLVSLLSNMALVPASGLAMALGFLMAFLYGTGFIFKGLAYITGVFMGVFIGGVRFFAALPFSSVSVAKPSAWFIAGIFVLAFSLLHAPLFGFRSRRLYLAAALGLGLTAYRPMAELSASGALRYRAVLFADSNTSAVLLSAPGGVFLVNPGMSGKKLADSVLAGGFRSVDGIFLTSLERKNYSGLAELAGFLTVKNVFLPYGPDPGELGRILSGLEKAGTRIHKTWPGELFLPGLKASAAWGGDSAGYSGRKDILDWEIGALKIKKEGASAEPACVCGPCGGAGPVSAQKGKTVALEFELPSGGCGGGLSDVRVSGP